VGPSAWVGVAPWWLLFGGWGGGGVYPSSAQSQPSPPLQSFRAEPEAPEAADLYNSTCPPGSPQGFLSQAGFFFMPSPSCGQRSRSISSLVGFIPPSTNLPIERGLITFFFQNLGDFFFFHSFFEDWTGTFLNLEDPLQ